YEADAPYPLRLLRARRQRPCRRAAEQRDELAPLHCLVPSVLSIERMIAHLSTQETAALRDFNSANVGSGSLADLALTLSNVRLRADIAAAGPRVRFVPEAAVSRCSKQLRYSITSSAVASSDGGTVRPSILAVEALMTSSNLLDCTTGRSAGLAP